MMQDLTRNTELAMQDAMQDTMQDSQCRTSNIKHDMPVSQFFMQVLRMLLRIIRCNL